MFAACRRYAANQQQLFAPPEKGMVPGVRRYGTWWTSPKVDRHSHTNQTHNPFARKSTQSTSSSSMGRLPFSKRLTSNAFTQRRFCASASAAQTPVSALSPIQRVAAFLKKNWFTLSLPPMVLFASKYPHVWKSGDDGLMAFDKWKDASVFGIFLASGLAIPVAQMRAVVMMVHVHAFIQSMTFLLAPLCFMATAPILREAGLPEPLVLGWLLCGCLPTSIGVTLALTRVGGGDVAVTLLNSAMSNILGVFVTPFVCLWATGINPSIDAMHVILKLTKVVAAPALLGMTLRHFVPIVGRYDAFWKTVQPLCLMPVLANVFSNAAPLLTSDSSGLSVQSLSIVAAATASMNFFLMSVIFALGTLLRISPQARVAATFCGAQKTAAMGVPMMTMMFSDDPNLGLLTLPLLFYHPIQAGVGGIFASIVRRRMTII